jgi:hypothetical protein
MAMINPAVAPMPAARRRLSVVPDIPARERFQETPRTLLFSFFKMN